MSWLFSRALVAEYSAGICSAGGQCAPWSGTPTPQACWWPDKTTDACPRSPSGMTFAPLTADHGEGVLTWYREGFPVRTFPQLEKVPGSAASAADSGGRWHESLVKFDPDSRSWKTRQYSLLGGLESFSETWPRWGMMRNGECWERATPVRLTRGNGSGLWPTPCAMEPEKDLDGQDAKRALPRAQRGGGNGDNLATRVKRLWTTPSASDGRRGGTITENMSGTSLAQQIRTPGMWPTPTVCGNYNRKGLSATSGDGLATVVKMWATPTASTGGVEPEGETGRKLVTQVGGSLNPTWVEWLMGFPLGWTDCAASGMDKFRQWQQQHSPSSAAGNELVG